MKPKGLAIVIGPAKPKEEDDESESEDSAEGGEESEYADLAYDAIKDGDKESFTKAFLGAVKACVEGYHDEEEPEDSE